MSHNLYAHRGFMLDTGRKYFSVSAIIALLNILHQNNYNIFHWHIIDAECFPVYWPGGMGLTNTSVQQSPCHSYYTQHDIHQIVTHGKSLDITVYPETDMPGHCDIWGLWKKDLVIGHPDLQNPNAVMDIRKDKTHTAIASMVATIDKYFGGAPLHHFGCDEVAYVWDTHDDNALFQKFIKWLRSLQPKKTRIMWDDPLTDEEKNITVAKDWVVQTWHNGVTQNVLDKGHRVIVSESAAFYIGNASPKTIRNFKFPDDPKVLGFEVVWFTSEDDGPDSFHEDWFLDPIRAAGRLRKKRTGGGGA